MGGETRTESRSVDPDGRASELSADARTGNMTFLLAARHGDCRSEGMYIVGDAKTQHPERE